MTDHPVLRTVEVDEWHRINPATPGDYNGLARLARRSAEPIAQHRPPPVTQRIEDFRAGDAPDH